MRSGSVFSMTARNVGKKAFGELVRCFLSVASLMRQKTMCLHDKRFYHQGKNASGIV
jgi:hypothetical protein